tara:strand:- start:1868 stop:2416 length:549 start_codon:yes stop_codon:yes gene_type:complete
MSEFGKLRVIVENDLELMRSWRNIPNVRANMYTQHEITQEEHLAWWQRVNNSCENLYLMYELNSLPAGVVYFNKIDRSSNNAAWGFYAAPNAPRGTGTKMEFLALDYAFKKLELHKLYCEVLEYNSPVIKLHGKFGFKQEGIFKQQFRCDEKYLNVYRLGILCSEWELSRDIMESKINSLSK